jgi:hypothetical protein
MAKSYSLIPLAFFTMFFVHVLAHFPLDSNWYDAHATFYGDMQGDETMRKYQIELPFFFFKEIDHHHHHQVL